MPALRSTAHLTKRIRQTPGLFRNFPTVFWDLGTQRTRFARDEMTLRLRNGYQVTIPNADGARYPIYEIFADDAWDEASWWRELAERPRRDYVVIEQADGGPAAYGGIDHAGGTADIMTVAVDPAHRGAGLGHRLVRELTRRAGARGAQALLLEVRADNAVAIALYAAHGFEVISTRRRYYQPGDIDALVMRALLRQEA